MSQEEQGAFQTLFLTTLAYFTPTLCDTITTSTVMIHQF